VQAVESLNKICEELSQQQIEENFIPLVLRLSKADWFTSKISATGLYQTPYSRATPPSQEALRQHYGQLVHDDTPMVRRQAANNLAKFIKAMPPSIVIEEMIPLFQHLAADDQDSVRLLTVDILIAIAEAVPKEQQSSHGVLLTALRSLFEDKSWRVRYMVADRFEKVRLECGKPEHALIGYRLRKLSTKRSSTETSSPRSSSSSRTQRPRSAARSRGRFQVSYNGGYTGWCHRDKWRPWHMNLCSMAAYCCRGLVVYSIFFCVMGCRIRANYCRLLRTSRARDPSARGYVQHRGVGVRPVTACPRRAWYPD
jgi:hypothetical protein